MKMNQWFVRLRNTPIPQRKLHPAKWLTLIAFLLLLAQLLETAGISDEFPAYARRSDARPVLFDKK